MKTFLIFSLFFCCGFFCSLQGAVLNSRSGTVTAAEITNAAVNISNLDTDAFPALPAKRIYAVLSVKLFPGRKISIFDYSLETRGVTYPCVAISTGSSFQSSEKSFSGNTVQLLFILEAANMSDVEKMNIKCNLPPTDGTYDITVPFKYIGRKTPVRANAVPADGLLEIR